MKTKLFKGIVTVTGAVLLSTLGIFAADSLQGIDGGLENLAGARKAGICNEGMVPLKMDAGVLCVDAYEASPSAACPHKKLGNIVDSEQNANVKECYAASVPGAEPWNYVSLPQAQRMCANTGKRLPTSEEWYRIALGTDPNSCMTQAQAASATGNKSCVSTVGAYDVVGNVWEWVDENVTGNMLDGRALPAEGYVTSVDASGIAISSADSADDLYGKDYFWSKEEGIFGMIRGGFYGSNQDAGLYTTNASVPTSFATQGVGFRCVEDVL